MAFQTTSASSSIIFIEDSLRNNNPLVIGPDIDCDFEIIFHHLDSSSVYNCTFMSPTKFCDKSNQFAIKLNYCGADIPERHYYLSNWMGYSMFIVEGTMLSNNGLMYSVVHYSKGWQKSPDLVFSLYNIYNISGKTLELEYYISNIPENWTFQDLLEYCKFLNESIEINYLEFY